MNNVFFAPNSGSSSGSSKAKGGSKMLPVLKLLGVLQIVADGKTFKYVSRLLRILHVKAFATSVNTKLSKPV